MLAVLDEVTSAVSEEAARQLYAQLHADSITCIRYRLLLLLPWLCGRSGDAQFKALHWVVSEHVCGAMRLPNLTESPLTLTRTSQHRPGLHAPAAPAYPATAAGLRPTFGRLGARAPQGLTEPQLILSWHWFSAPGVSPVRPQHCDCCRLMIPSLH